jgi:hypothetical protein
MYDLLFIFPQIDIVVKDLEYKCHLVAGDVQFDLSINFLINKVEQLRGGCMVGWTNLEVTQFTFLLHMCDCNCHIVLNILESLNGMHFEVIGFNMYRMQLISMQNS